VSVPRSQRLMQIETPKTDQCSEKYSDGFHKVSVSRKVGGLK